LDVNLQIHVIFMVLKHFFLGFCMIFADNGLFCQLKDSFSINYATKGVKILSPKFPFFPKSDKKTLIPQNFYLNQPGFFCRQEIKFYKSTGMPLKFRLGSVSDCDRLEGKHEKRVDIQRTTGRRAGSLK
jgi:hypothetical protein